jgi:hypothetical protein
MDDIYYAIHTVLLKKENQYFSLWDIQQKIKEYNLLENFEIITDENFNNMTEIQTLFIICCNDIDNLDRYCNEHNKFYRNLQKIYYGNVLYIILNKNENSYNTIDYNDINKNRKKFNVITFFNAVVKHNLYDKINITDYYDENYNLFHYICYYGNLETIKIMCKYIEKYTEKFEYDDCDNFGKIIFEYDNVENNIDIYNFLNQCNINTKYKILEKHIYSLEQNEEKLNFEYAKTNQRIEENNNTIYIPIIFGLTMSFMILTVNFIEIINK